MNGQANNNVLFVKCSVNEAESGILLTLNKIIVPNRNFKLEIKDLRIDKDLFIPIKIKANEEIMPVFNHAGNIVRSDSLRKYFFDNSYHKKIILNCFYGSDFNHITIFNKMRKSEVLK